MRSISSLMLLLLTIGLMSSVVATPQASAQEAGGGGGTAPLTVTLTSSRAVCTANTLTELTWTITGGVPPYRLTVAGEAVDPDAESATVTCGALPESATEAPGTITATVTDATGAPATASATYTIVPPLPAPTGLEHVSPYPGSVQTSWSDVPGAAEMTLEDAEGTPYTIDAYLVRYRAVGASEWIHVLQERTVDDVWEVFDAGIREFSVAALRHPLERLTPAALRWSAAHPYAAVAAPQNVVATATHDTVTVSWDKQPHGEPGVVWLSGAGGGVSEPFPMATSAGRYSITFGDLPPSTTYNVYVDYQPPERPDDYTRTEVTTLAPPPDYEPLPSGPQNLRATATHNSITVSWDPSRPATPLRYSVQVFHAESGIRVDVRDLPEGTTSVTVIGTFWRIQPDTLYEVVVFEDDIRGASAEVSVTTPAAPAPLRLTLAAERAECTAGTLNPVSWEISGGVEPYRLTVDGASVDADAEGAHATCGALPDYGIWLPVTQAPGTITAVVTDDTGAPATASAAYTIVPPLPAPTGVVTGTGRTSIGVRWDRVAAAGPVPGLGVGCPCPLYLLRWRAAGTETWATALARDRTSSSGQTWARSRLLDLDEGTAYEFAVATLRHAIEQQTSAALDWSTAVTATTVAPATGVQAVATHDTITVSWDAQPAVLSFTVSLRGPHGGTSQTFTADGRTPHQVVFRQLPPGTEYTAAVLVEGEVDPPRTEITVSTTAAPADWTPLPRGPQNLRTALTHNSVTVAWDVPYVGAGDIYDVRIEPTAGGRSQGTAVYGGATTHTFTGLVPATSYDVVVRHADIVVGDARTSVTTASAPTAAQSTGPVITCIEITPGWRICWTPAAARG